MQTVELIGVLLVLALVAAVFVQLTRLRRDSDDSAILNHGESTAPSPNGSNSPDDLALRERVRRMESGVPTDTLAGRELAEVVGWVRAQQPRALDLAMLFRDLVPDEDLREGDSLVQVVSDSRAVVFGTEESARSLGAIVGRASQSLARASRHATSAADAGIEAAKSTGFLVELSAESRAAWKSQEKIRTAAGDILGILRNGDTKKFSHVLKVRPAKFAQTAASGAAILSAIAGQAQLDQIERQLGEIAEDIGSLRADVRDRHEAELLGALRLLGEVYAAARSTSVLSLAMWDQIAPIAHVVYTLQEESVLRLRRAKTQLQELKTMKVADRRERLDELAAEIDYALRLAYSEERAVVQFHLLRAWHLAAQDDPSLSHALQEVVTDSVRRRDALRDLQQTVVLALDNPDVAPLLQRARVWSRRGIRESASKLLETVDGRTGMVVSLPLLEVAVGADRDIDAPLPLSAES